jgi:hypothetical protein
MRYLGIAFCALALTAIVASPAWAAFPGRERVLELLLTTPGASMQRVTAASVGDGYAALANVRGLDADAGRRKLVCDRHRVHD